MNIYSFSGSMGKPIEKTRMKKLLGPSMMNECHQQQNVIQEKKSMQSKQAKVIEKQHPFASQPKHERIKINSFHSLGMICKIGKPQSPAKTPFPPTPREININNLFTYQSPIEQKDDLNCTEDIYDERTFDSQDTNYFHYPLQSKKVKFTLPCESPKKGGDSLTQLFANSSIINSSISLPELYEIDHNYIIDPHYLTDYEDLNQDDRLYQLLSLKKVKKDLQLTKQTLQVSIEYMDRLLDRSRNICKINAENFPLYATVCLSIAAKQHETIPPKIEQFMKYLSTTYTTPLFIQTEIKILQILKWTLHPVTHQNQMFHVLKAFQIFSQSNHSTFFLCQYADYIQSYIMRRESKSELAFDEGFLKRINKTLEIILLDYENLIYPQQSVCFSLLYLLAGVEVTYFKTEPLNENSNNTNLRNIHTFRNQSRFLFEESPQNAFFKSFLKYYDSSLNELLPTIQYISTFLSINYKKKNQKMSKIEIIRQKNQIDQNLYCLDFY